MARKSPAKSGPRPAPAAEPKPRGLRWPLWTAAALAAFYLIAHFAMLPMAFTLWGGLLSALVLGQ